MSPYINYFGSKGRSLRRFDYDMCLWWKVYQDRKDGFKIEELNLDLSDVCCGECDGLDELCKKFTPLKYYRGGKK